MTSDTARFVALLPVRDEGDIIAECLVHALNWADRIYVYDTGSIDETWDIVHELAKSCDRIVPVNREQVYYNENRVRGLLFETARDFLREGDWFLRLDADEFHHMRPQDFVASQLAPGEGTVYHQYYDFQLARSEAGALATEQRIADERRLPVAERRRKFTISAYAEPRMCRYRLSMRWPATVSFPFNAGLIAKARIPIRHYPHRDPKQLERRCRLRAVMMADRKNSSNWTRPDLHHWTASEWQSLVIDDEAVGLHYWERGADLPEVRQMNHLPSGGKRLVQRAIYALGLPRIIDRTRGKWSSEAHPLPISIETQAVLARELKS